MGVFLINMFVFRLISTRASNLKTLYICKKRSQIKITLLFV